MAEKFRLNNQRFRFKNMLVVHGRQHHANLIKNYSQLLRTKEDSIVFQLPVRGNIHLG